MSEPPADRASATGWIYAVHDEAGGVVYVGQTRLTVMARYRGHSLDAERSTGGPPFIVWLRGQLAMGVVPRVTTLEQPSVSDLTCRERFWIETLANVAPGRLLNVCGITETSRQANAVPTHVERRQRWRESEDAAWARRVGDKIPRASKVPR